MLLILFLSIGSCSDLAFIDWINHWSCLY